MDINNIVDSSMPLKIQLSIKTKYRWIETDNVNKNNMCVHQEEEEFKQGCFHINVDISNENLKALIFSKLGSNLPTLDSKQIKEASYRIIKTKKGFICVSLIALLYQDYVCDKTMLFQLHCPASLSLMLKKNKMMMNIDEENCSGICFGELAMGTQVICMRCSHYFHIRCLWSWLTRRGNCPICRYEPDVE
ncbi:E3 ubiquitin-protein ligase like [Capsicum annuum]|uniref:E3 ubiquitin-protein ligase RNF167-like n=1 Tax=Capsicum annuum TaxID=4072 RepID=UPI001FB164BE|nr:E3 ubiquitin-protein ligase RNF167-like [Capsicum annuum]